MAQPVEPEHEAVLVGLFDGLRLALPKGISVHRLLSAVRRGFRTAASAPQFELPSVL